MFFTLVRIVPESYHPGTVKKPLTILCLLGFLCIVQDHAAAQSDPRRYLEHSYMEKSQKLDSTDTAARLELARWCRQKGFIREMLREVNLVLNYEPASAEARALVMQKAEGDGWVYALPPSLAAALPLPDSTQTAGSRRRLLKERRSADFKMAKKAFRFQYWTDVGRDRCSFFSQAMNRYYDRLKGFFSITKTEIGIDVVIFSKRSDYLGFYNRCTGASGEHSNGFFSYGNSLLCFHDEPYDTENVLNTAKHECTHLLVKHCLKGSAPALWLNEGLACYFAADGPERSGPYAARCLFTVRNDIRNKKAIPLDELMRIPQDSFRFREYATAWSWIHYLHNNPDMKGKLGRFIRKLRQSASQIDEEENEGELERVTNSLFRETFGPAHKLQPLWTDYVMKELVPPEGRDRAEYIQKCLDHAVSRSKEIRFAEKIEALKEGEELARRDGEDGGETGGSRRLLDQAWCILSRARCMKYDQRETAFAVTEVYRILEEFLKETHDKVSSYDAGLAAYNALVAIWKSGDFEEKEDEVACDFASMLDEKEESRMATSAEKALARLQKSLVENLSALARYSYATTLSLDPAHQPAATNWLYLALGFSPKEMEAAFPHVLFMTELDPNDYTLTALAAAYAGLGKQRHAKSLLDKAYSMAADRNDLYQFGNYVNKGEN